MTEASGSSSLLHVRRLRPCSTPKGQLPNTEELRRYRQTGGRTLAAPRAYHRPLAEVLLVE